MRIIWAQLKRAHALLFQGDRPFARDLHRIDEDGKGKDEHAGLVRLVEEQVDMDALLEIAAGAAVPPAPLQLLPEPAPPPPRIRLAVARDVAFGHSYSE